MVDPGKRRILKRAAMALAVAMVLVAALKFLMPGGPSAIEQSSALRLGMTCAEVAAVMGVEKISIQQRPKMDSAVRVAGRNDIPLSVFDQQLDQSAGAHVQH